MCLVSRVIIFVYEPFLMKGLLCGKLSFVITCKGSVADDYVFGVSRYYICVRALSYVRALVQETVVRDHM